jgi:hypothetical protein
MRYRARCVLLDTFFNLYSFNTMKAYKHLVNYAIKAGLTVSVHDGEEWAVKKSVNKSEIFSAIESVEECSLRFRDKPGELVAWAFLTPYEGEEESVNDYSVCPFMDKWYAAYELTVK